MKPAWFNLVGLLLGVLALHATADDLTEKVRAQAVIPTADESVAVLLGKIIESQWNETQNRNYSLKLLYEHNTTLYEDKGLWQSFIRYNFHGQAWEMRDKISIPDSNFFSTGWVMEILLSDMLSSFMAVTNSSNVSDLWQSLSHSSLIAVQALSEFQDRNSAAGDDESNMRVSFWLQQYNYRLKDYCAYPTNFMDPMVNTLNHSAFVIALSELVTGDAKAALDFLDSVAGSVRTFGIPADADDTSLLASLSVSLYDSMSYNDANDEVDNSNNPFTMASEWWFENVPFAKGFDTYAQNVKRYAYRPFSGNFDNSVIDPRTFYWLRHYLYQLQTNLTETELTEVAFITTWFQNETEMLRNDWEHVCYQTPLSVNNLDASVVANSLFGLLKSLEWSVSVGNGADDWFDSEMQTMYLRNIDLIIWIIQEDWITQRPDLLLTYYPPKFNFYWFVSRIFDLLKNTQSSKVQLLMQSYPMFEQVRQRLEVSLKGSVTQKLHSLIESDAPGQIVTVGQFWSDFLGQKDEPIAHCDDCLYSTGVASLTLMNIWSECVLISSDNDECGCHNTFLLHDTPSYVRSDLASANEFVKYYSVDADGQAMMADNVFFSGSIKSNTTYPWSYPANVWTYASGIELDPTQVTTDDVNANLCCGVEEIIDDLTYQQRIDMDPCGYQTPESFAGYNSVGSVLIYWATPPVTLALDLLAVAQYSCLLAG